MKLFILLALAGLMSAARSFSVASAHGPSVSLTFGYLLLTAFFAGGLFAMIRLPRLTGYIVAGIIVGPSVIGHVAPSVVPHLEIFNGVAVSMIALSAGVALEIKATRPLFRSIGAITLGTKILVVPLLALAIYLLRSQLPFMTEMSAGTAAVIALVLGVTMSAASPAVAVALREELAADGPVTRTVLATVVVSDMLTLVTFAIVSAVARSAIGDEADVIATALRLGWELIGSLIAGSLIGGVLVLYLRRVASGAAMFTVVVCFTLAEVGHRIDFDPLLLSLAAGIVVRNFSDAGDRLQREIARSSLPVYVIFFAVAGASIHIEVLPLVGIPAAIVVVVRAFSLLAGARLGAELTGADRNVARFAGLGLLPQAGLAIALAQVFAKTFPELGSGAPALILAVVAINEIVCPALYRLGIVASGEVGQLRSAEAAPEHETEAKPSFGETISLPPTA